MSLSIIPPTLPEEPGTPPPEVPGTGDFLARLQGVVDHGGSAKPKDQHVDISDLVSLFGTDKFGSASENVAGADISATLKEAVRVAVAAALEDHRNEVDSLTGLVSTMMAEVAAAKEELQTTTLALQTAVAGIRAAQEECESTRRELADLRREAAKEAVRINSAIETGIPLAERLESLYVNAATRIEDLLATPHGQAPRGDEQPWRPEHEVTTGRPAVSEETAAVANEWWRQDPDQAPGHVSDLAHVTPSEPGERAWWDQGDVDPVPASSSVTGPNALPAWFSQDEGPPVPASQSPVEPGSPVPVSAESRWWE